jgi:hypothetical protein
MPPSATAVTGSTVCSAWRSMNPNARGPSRRPLAGKATTSEIGSRRRATQLMATANSPKSPSRSRVVGP